MATSIRINNIVRVVLIVAFASLLYNIFSSSDENNPRRGRHFRRPKFSRKPTQNSAMASQYLKNIAGRRSIYALTKESTISNARLQEILTETIKHSPSSFNNQAGRAVLLLGDSHDKLWALAEETVKSKLPPQAYDGLKPKIYGYKNGYGTIMFFEAAEALKPYKDAHPEMPFDEWSDHSAGKHSLSHKLDIWLTRTQACYKFTRGTLWSSKAWAPIFSTTTSYLVSRI